MQPQLAKPRKVQCDRIDQYSWFLDYLLRRHIGKDQGFQGGAELQDCPEVNAEFGLSVEERWAPQLQVSERREREVDLDRGTLDAQRTKGREESIE